MQVYVSRSKTILFMLIVLVVFKQASTKPLPYVNRLENEPVNLFEIRHGPGYTKTVKVEEEVYVTENVLTRTKNEKFEPLQEQLIAESRKVGAEAAVGSLQKSPPGGATTMHPMEAFCMMACEEGLAGPECDCPGHPVG